MTFNPTVQALLDGPHFGVLATINPDGSPQGSAMWVGRDGDDVVFSTVDGRRKVRNIQRDPRVSVTIMDRDDPYNYVEIRGTATIEQEGGRELDDRLSWDYDGKAADEEPESVVRVVVRVKPTRLTGYAADPPRSA
jgi:PPOX class probable F420-dependent enzyme